MPRLAILALSLLCAVAPFSPARAADTPAPAPAPAPAGGPVILSEAGIWRAHITWMTAVTRKADGGLEPSRVWGNPKTSSPLPPAEWAAPEFDDSSWGYWREPRPARTFKANKTGARSPKPQDLEDTGLPFYDDGQYGVGRSYFMGLRCFRARFAVDDPGAARDLSLAVRFRGGVVAYLNGQEIGRAALPKDGKLAPDALADDYPEEASLRADGKLWENQGRLGAVSDVESLKRLNIRIRTLEVKVPASALRAGGGTY